MNEFFSVAVKAARGTRRVPVGPLGDAIPSRFAALIRRRDDPFMVRLDALFEGDRVVVQEVSVKTTGESLQSQDIARVKLGEIVRWAGEAATRPGHGSYIGRRPGRRPNAEELKLVAAVYCVQHAIWGRPREAVMEIWEIPRSTANRWITMARDLYDMPGGE